MNELDRLNKLLPDLLLRMELAEKKAVGFHACVNLSKIEFDIIAQTYILQEFGYKLNFKAIDENDLFGDCDFKLIWLL